MREHHDQTRPVSSVPAAGRRGILLAGAWSAPALTAVALAPASVASPGVPASIQLVLSQTTVEPNQQVTGTATVFDSLGNPVPAGTVVTLNLSRFPNGAATFTQADFVGANGVTTTGNVSEFQALTDANGQVSFTALATSTGKISFGAFAQGVATGSEAILDIQDPVTVSLSYVGSAPTANTGDRIETGLRFRLVDSADNPVRPLPGNTVTVTVDPATPFADGTTSVDLVTDADGYVTLPAISVPTTTASGPYNISATATVLGTPYQADTTLTVTNTVETFALTNASSSNPLPIQSGSIVNGLAALLQGTKQGVVRNVPNIPVTFTIPAGEPFDFFLGAGSFGKQFTVTTDSNGIAAAPGIRYASAAGQRDTVVTATATIGGTQYQVDIPIRGISG